MLVPQAHGRGQCKPGHGKYKVPESTVALRLRHHRASDKEGAGKMDY